MDGACWWEWKRRDTITLAAREGGWNVCEVGDIVHVKGAAGGGRCARMRGTEKVYRRVVWVREARGNECEGGKLWFRERVQ